MKQCIKTKRGLYIDLWDSDIIIHIHGYYFKFESEYRKKLFLKHYKKQLYVTQNIQIDNNVLIEPLFHDYFIFSAILAYYRTQKKTLVVNFNGDEICLKNFTIRAKIKIT